MSLRWLAVGIKDRLPMLALPSRVAFFAALPAASEVELQTSTFASRLTVTFTSAFR
jgi:hypothetical protein